MESARFNFSRDLQECIGHVNHGAGQSRLRRYHVLIAVRAEDVDVTLLGGLQDTQTCRVGVMDQEIRAAADFSQCGFLGCADILEAAGVADKDMAGGAHRGKA